MELDFGPEIAQFRAELRDWAARGRPWPARPAPALLSPTLLAPSGHPVPGLRPRRGSCWPPRACRWCPANWHGVDMKADAWILLSFPAANRDPAQFDRAGEVVIDREVNRHAAFGLGIHRCVGSHLARMELRVALEVWLERIGEFSLADPSAVTWSAGQIRGPRTLPLRLR